MTGGARGADAAAWLAVAQGGAHVALALLAWAVLRRLPGVSRRGGAAAGAALFALHPLQVAPAGGEAALGPLVAAALALGALAAHLRASGAGGRPAAASAWHGAAALLAGLAAAGSAATLAAVWLAVLAHRAGGRRPLRDRRLALGLGAMALAGAVGAWLSPVAAAPRATAGAAGPLDHALLAIHAVGGALEALLWPWPVAVCADGSPAAVLSQQAWLGPAALLAGAAGAAFALRRVWPELGWGLAALPALLLPGADGAAPAGAAPHVALLGPAWALAAGWSRLPDGPVRRVAGGALVALAGAWALLAARGTPVVAPREPACAPLHGDAPQISAQLELGAALAAAGRPEEALRHLRRAAERDPRRAEAWEQLARVTRALDRGEVLVDAARAARVDPASSRELALELGQAHLRAGRLAEAEDAARRWLARSEADAEAHLLLGVALGAQGRPAEAIPHFERALALRPDLALAAQNLAAARRAVGGAEP